MSYAKELLCIYHHSRDKRRISPYDDACSLDGEPDTYEGSPRVSAWLEDPSSTDSSNLIETWPLTDRLFFGISVNQMESAALIRLEYRLVVDTSSYPFTAGRSPVPALFTARRPDKLCFSD